MLRTGAPLPLLANFQNVRCSTEGRPFDPGPGMRAMSQSLPTTCRAPRERQGVLSTTSKEKALGQLAGYASRRAACGGLVPPLRPRAFLQQNGKKEDAAGAAPSSKSGGGALMALGEGVMRNTSLLHPREKIGLDP